MGTVVCESSLSTPSINIISPCSSSSASSTPTSTCTVVPQYPYNVSMPPFAGALLPYERSPMPDDNDVQTRLPSRCVDYLSHDWDESDVWTSWKAMTRHKNEMANGVRLENASWRTWAKQRSNLKTISPETLNWLKDSDVTWLYGPLHTAVDPVPPPRMSSLQDRFNLEDLPSQNPPESLPGSSVNSRPGSSASVRSNKMPGKPILKHRSLSEILGVPQSTSSHSSGDREQNSEPDDEPTFSEANQLSRPRVAVSHTASDSTLATRDHQDAGRGTPQTLGYESSEATTSGEDSDANHAALRPHPPPSVPGRKTALRTTSGARTRGSDEPVRPKKHISFSHRVEQCIAVDSEEERTAYATKGNFRASNGRTQAVLADQANDDDDEDDEDDDDDDDVLTFRSSAPRQPGLHAVSSRYSSNFGPGKSLDSNGVQLGLLGSTSSGSATPTEPYTIARMAPTTLKSSEVLPAPSPVVVYDRGPVWASVQSHTSGGSYTSYTVTSSPSPTMATSSDPNQPSQARPIAVPSSRTDQSFAACPSHTYGPVTSSKVSSSSITTSSAEDRPLGPVRYGSSSSINQWGSTTPTDDDDTEEFTAMGFDYFSGPDLGLGDEYDISRLPSHQIGSFQGGFNSSEGIGVTINEDHTLPRPVFTPNVQSPPGGSPARNPAGGSGSKFGFQEAIMVPQLKSHSCKSSTATSSSSSSSLASSPLFHPNDSSSSSIVNSHPNEPCVNSTGLPISTSSSSSTLGKSAASSYERLDRFSRGRPPSRGSSASSFDRSSVDRRPSSASPSQSPSSNSRFQSRVSASPSSCPTSSSSRPPARPAGVGIRANSHDGSRSFAERSCLINATIGEEAEEDGDEILQRSQSTTNLEKATQDLKKKFPPSTNDKEGSSNSKPQSRHSSRSPQKPDLVSAPKLASAQLHNAQSAVQETKPLTLETCLGSESVPHIRMEGRGESTSSPSSPIVLSLLSKQSGSPSSISSSRWSDERSPGPLYRSRRNEKPSPSRSRPSLRPRGSMDSSSSNFLIRSSVFENERSMVGTDRPSKSMDAIRRLSGDEFGFVNYYGDVNREDEEIGQDEGEAERGGGVISRAAEIVGTAREIVGAIWSVGSRSLWGGGGANEGNALEGSGTDKERRVFRRASTGELSARVEDEAQSRSHNH